MTKYADKILASSIVAPDEITIKQYRSIKKKLIKTERTNCHTIQVVPCCGKEGWHEIADISALIYYYYVCQKLDIKTKFHADNTNFPEHYNIGYIRTRDLDVVRNRIKQVNLYDSENIDKNGFHIFNLNISLTVRQLEDLIEQENSRRLVNLIPIECNNLDPKLHQLLVASATRLHHICNARLNKISSQTNGKRMVRLIDELLREYHQIIMMPNIPPARLQEKLTNMRVNIYNLIIEIQILGETNLWDLELCSSVCVPICEARDRIENSIREINRKCNQ